MKVKILFFVSIVLLMVSCKEPEARRPKQQGTTDFYKEILAKNKKLNALEQQKLAYWISKDTLNTYITSADGFWYTYNKKDSLQTVTPKLKDVVTLLYDVKSINGSIIYETQQRNYVVDKEDFIPALQSGIKLMKKGETITFVIPSYRAFGVIGDGNKIAVNQPIKSTVTLIDIKSNQ